MRPVNKPDAVQVHMLDKVLFGSAWQYTVSYFSRNALEMGHPVRLLKPECRHYPFQSIHFSHRRLCFYDFPTSSAATIAAMGPSLA
ncbi:hypothetical protein ES705_43635 [subsurface metagenome]